jgi:hypothetical protein
MPLGSLPAVVTENSVTVPDVVTRAILFPGAVVLDVPTSTNQRLPSGPAVMS